ncbi:hypothetical protein B0H19DRAFT_1378563, partial [Mycena capillaripes]
MASVTRHSLVHTLVSVLLQILGALFRHYQALVPRSTRPVLVMFSYPTVAFQYPSQRLGPAIRALETRFGTDKNTTTLMSFYLPDPSG